MAIQKSPGNGTRARCLLFPLLFAAGMAGAAQGSGPVVRLFPTNVLDDIRETSEVAEAMENSLQEVIGRLDLQQELYMESLCQGSEGDQGCDRIAKQLGATYLEMLTIMGDRLPEMELAVNNTGNSLEKRLRDELGHRTTPTSLQDTLLGETASGAPATERLALRGRSGVRLSDRFQQYYQLVATHRDGPGNSLAVVAADIYLDMQEASALIAATRQEIGRAALMEQLNQSFGLITPEMMEVVGGVKGILFGDAGADEGFAAPPYEIGEEDFVSPLAL